MTKDTGSSRSFYNLDDAGPAIKVKLGEKEYTFQSNKLNMVKLDFKMNLISVKVSDQLRFIKSKSFCYYY